MIDTTQGPYLELEQKLYFLRAHFEMCRGVDNKQLLDWARFFVDWSKAASQYCGSWAPENLRNAEHFAKNLEKSKMGDMGYEVLESLMAEAGVRLNREILQSLRNGEAVQGRA